ncbi:hypothetical protein ACFC8F_03015 [Streptomyces hydrogenans]|uniref:hypothetical protein n=1 Tax=Streptomyces hydrogenans TaxID=1873719 RepID=UPI0035E0F51B
MTASTPVPRPSRSKPRRRRHSLAAMRHFVRGLSYGTGLTLAGLLGYWIQQML